MSNSEKSQKVLILTINHIWYDARVYFKVICSLLKNDVEVRLLTGNSVTHASSLQKNQQNRAFSYKIIPKGKKKLRLLIHFIAEGIKYKPDIVICIEPLSLISGFILKKILKCRFVYDCHEYFAEAYGARSRQHEYIRTQMYWFFERFFASFTDSIITVNEHLVKQLKKANKNTYLCANYLNKELFGDIQSFVPNDIEYDALNGRRQAPPLQRTEKKKYDLIYMGSIAFERGLKVYLKTAKLFKEKQKTFKFLIIGSFKDSATERYFFDYIKYHKLEHFVFYMPYMPHEMLLKAIRESKIGIYMGEPDQNKRYHKTINMKVFEYFSQSIPVIINKLEMLSELVNKSQSGWIIDYDSKKLFDLLCKILDDEKELTNKGELGYVYAKENLVWERQEPELFKAVFGDVITVVAELASVPNIVK